MNLKQQTCKTRSLFLLSQLKERRGREKHTVFDPFIDEIFNESWDGVSLKSQLLPYFSDFLEEWPRYTPKKGILALLNRKNYSRVWNRKQRIEMGEQVPFPSGYPPSPNANGKIWKKDASVTHPNWWAYARPSSFPALSLRHHFRARVKR